MEYSSRKSPVLSIKGVCSTSNPLASKIGTQILERGGNAADACIGISAALSVLEPCSTGLGGDCFCLYFDAKTKKISCLNGSGKSPMNLTLENFAKKTNTKIGSTKIKKNLGANCVTVPGACAGWEDCLKHFGRLKLSDVLKDVIELCDGFPVHEITAHFWNKAENMLKISSNGEELLLNGKSPQHGDIWVNKSMKKVLEDLSIHGKDVFYNGWIAKEIVNVINENGGEMTLDDLKNHKSYLSDPISIDYKGYKIYEVGPNSQGLCVLIAMNILEGIDLKSLNHNSSEYIHIVTEALKISFAEVKQHICDPEKTDKKILDMLLSKEFAEKKRKEIDMKVCSYFESGFPLTSSDTVQFCCVDSEGNACSFVNSNYQGFGTCIVPKGCGFSLQNRGSNFTLERGHPNCYAPSKRPYHTIIPGLCTFNGDLKYVFGVMGGFMQPQGHTQVLLNMIEFNMNPQEALDKSRFCIIPEIGEVELYLEEGIHKEVYNKLVGKKHKVYHNINGWNRSLFGRGQIIEKKGKVLWAGSDSRSDGSSIPLI